MTFERSNGLDEKLANRTLDIAALKKTLDGLPAIAIEHIVNYMIRANELANEIVASNPLEAQRVSAMLKVAEKKSGLLLAESEIAKINLQDAAANDDNFAETATGAIIGTDAHVHEVLANNIADDYRDAA